MKTVTAAHGNKLAKAARELAGEYAEGRGPSLEAYNYCGCVIGQVFKRAKVPNPPPGNAANDLEEEIGCVDLTQATFHEIGTRYSEKIPGAVVFPLLALADELEARQ